MVNDQKGEEMALKKTEKGFYVLEELSRFPDIIHGFSTRDFGNMAFTRGNFSKVAKNRSEFAKAVDFDPNSVAQMELVHGTNIEVADKESAGSLIDDKNFFPATDGLISQSLGITLFLVTADCAPVLFYDPRNKAIGICHAGLRSVVLGIPRKMVYKMRDEFGTKHHDLIVGIGPSIGPYCYDLSHSVMWRKEVKKEFKSLFPQKEKFILNREGKRYFNLWDLIVHHLVKSGVRRKNIEVGKICTVCHHDEFFSNFKARTPEKKVVEGRFASVIGLRK